MATISIDLDKALVTVDDGSEPVTYPMASAEGFAAASEAWLRCGWDAKYVYGFSWFGRPIIQLPEDLVRIQEVVYRVRPTLIVETGIAHGGSLVFYASLMKAMGEGRVIGVDVEVRPHNRRAIEEHELTDWMTIIEGSSTAPEVVGQVAKLVRPEDRVLVVLDSNHTKEHVLGELDAYAPLVSTGSYVVVCDGIMERIVGAPRTRPDWASDNPRAAVEEWIPRNPGFVVEEPEFPFNEGMVRERVTYWPGGYIRREAATSSVHPKGR